MKTNTDVLIIGGGLAGLASAIHLSGQGMQVTLVEKSGYPRHKVCGEYISNEILPYLIWLGAAVSELHPTAISQFEFTTTNGRSAKARLPLGGFGVSRYALDHFLFEKAIANGCQILQETVTGIAFDQDVFSVSTSHQTLTSKIVLGAYGKRSNIDQVLARDFIHKKSSWLAVKAHYSGDFPDDLVALHNFNGGYCGVSKVEHNRINICYLADYATFKRYKNIEEYQNQVLYQNKNLKTVFENSTLLFEKPITISQISFDPKQPVEQHVLMIGDTAGLIHPLCGNGMAIALHSAKIAAELVLDFQNGRISRDLLEKTYTQRWKTHFGRRMLMGRLLAKILSRKKLAAILISIVASLPGLLPLIIKQTHGKPIVID
ncbi:NAD(P)/FAD-dependent oxidoreductase [Flavobacterium circumlabens]|uniref:Flavin-dependent dehydrogenase n=1 Tax=Flavobacterium circumlabens TaxID=2133765 RepID=A0A4Y7U7H0_9FLAO|nr:NAD(P)/FAD-dependent oxidoreductase [Flavobacterium circumlabens]TCN53049.1 flavin-dependent dehydrogenase [Flavobacterium circumlabens]TEB42396.1 NAD(P)/FAD-dependent oxidoreductase [Flavobacterium circumlabens]